MNVWAPFMTNIWYPFWLIFGKLFMNSFSQVPSIWTGVKMLLEVHCQVDLTEFAEAETFLVIHKTFPAFYTSCSWSYKHGIFAGNRILICVFFFF